jgi:hypothetical protein
MTVEGYVLQPIKFGRSDVDHSSALYVPGLDALIAGDMIYNDLRQSLRGRVCADRLPGVVLGCGLVSREDLVEPAQLVRGQLKLNGR